MVKNGENQKVIEQIDNKNKRNEQQKKKKKKKTQKPKTKKNPWVSLFKKTFKNIFLCV